MYSIPALMRAYYDILYKTSDFILFYAGRIIFTQSLTVTLPYIGMCVPSQGYVGNRKLFKA